MPRRRLGAVVHVAVHVHGAGGMRCSGSWLSASGGSVASTGSCSYGRHRKRVTTGSATTHSAVTVVSTSPSLSPDAIRCPGSRQTASYSSASATDSPSTNDPLRARGRRQWRPCYAGSLMSTTLMIVLLVTNFVILAVLSARLWSLRAEMRRDTLRSAIDAQGDSGVREQRPRSPTPIAHRPDPLAAAAVQRERAAYLQGLLEGRRLGCAMMGGEVAVAAAPRPRPAGPEEGAGPAETARVDEKASRVFRVIRFRQPGPTPRRGRFE